MSSQTILCAVPAILLFALSAPSVFGQSCYSGICFPGGPASFADTVLRYDPTYSGGCVATFAPFLDPNSALGEPNYGLPADGNVVSIGSGGLIELGFVDNSLLNSGTPSGDLHIFEAGGVPESVFVAVRPADALTLARVVSGGLPDLNGDGYFELGLVGGFTSSIDLDVFVPGFGPGDLVFDAVQIIDDISNQPSCTIYAGAEIDAVGASPVSEIGVWYCSTPVVNSTGVPGQLAAAGSAFAADNSLQLLVGDLPAGAFGFCIVSQTQDFVNPPASDGELCLGGSIGRILTQIFQGPNAVVLVDLTRLPLSPMQSVMPGETWNFQAWHRDFGNTNNFTNAVSIAYQ